MAEILERFGNESQLGKVLFELLGEIASSAISKANKQENSVSRGCKSVPVSPKESITTPRMAKSDCESEEKQCVGGTKTVDPSLGRPRYQWQVPGKCGNYEKDHRKSNDELKKLFSVYVGHLPSDITEDELVDLFKDIGEVIDAFVLPCQNGNSYTYGFVRFLTLDEAKDAVREKHLKAIGNKQIHVELSADTRRKMQDRDTDEDRRQLLRKDYPKVVRRSADNSNEKKVIAKVKTSIRKLNDSRSCVFGECSSEELFENVKTILKMVINFPMSLADATADEGGEPSREDPKEIPSSQEQPRGCDDESFPVDKGSLVRSVSMTGRRPVLSAIDPNSMYNDIDEHRAKLDTSPVLDSNKSPSLPSRRAIETAPATSTFCPLVEKVRHLLNASPSEHPALSNGLPFVGNSESCSSPTSRLGCESQPGSPTDLASSALQHGLKTHVDADLASLGLQSDDHPSARPYAEVREKNDVPCVAFKQQPTELPLPSNHVSHANSYREDMRQTDGRQFVEGIQRTGTVFVPCDQQPTASKMPSNVASHSKSLQQNVLQTDGKQFVDAIQRTDPVFVSWDQLPKASLPSVDSGDRNSFGSQLNAHEVSPFVNGDQCVKAPERTSVTAVSLNLRPKILSSLANDTIHCNRFGSQENVLQQTNDGKCVEAEQRTGTTYAPFNQQSRTPYVNLNDADHCNRFGSDRETNLENGSTYPNLCDSVNGFAADGPVEIARSVCRAVTNTCEIASEETTETAVERSPHSQSLGQSRQPSVSSTYEHCENLSTKPNLFNQSQNDNVPIDSSASTKLTKIDRVAFSSMVSIISQSPQTILTNASDCKSAVLDNVSSGSHSDGVNASKSDMAVISNIFPKPSEETRCPLSPCMEDASPPCSKFVANISTPRSSLFDKIQTETNIMNCSIQELNSVVNTGGELERATFTPSNGQTHAVSYSDKTVSRKEIVTKPPIRQKRTLAPSFAKFIRTGRNGEGDSEDKPSNFVLPKLSSGFENYYGSFPSENLRPSATGVFRSDGVKNEAGDVMTDDSAILNISRANVDLQQHKLSPDGPKLDYHSREDVDSGFESSVPRNDLEQCKKEDDAETKILKENLKEQHLRLKILQQSFSSRHRYKREKTRQWFEDNRNSMELETKIHDAEVLLQKKIENWSSRSSEQELAFERETLLPVDNTELLKQLSKEMEKEYLRNEICVTELKCDIVELKMKHFNEKNGIEN